MGIRSDLDANFDYEIVDEFLDHYSMMVDSMEVMIIDLSKPNLQNRCIDELFRVFHNIKSASSFLKIEPMSRLSTLVEDELEEYLSFDMFDRFGGGIGVTRMVSAMKSAGLL